MKSTFRQHICLKLLLFGLAALVLRVQGRAQIQATSIPLVLPSALAFDGQGNLYVAETGGHAVRRIDPAGHITTGAGNGSQGLSGDGGPTTSAQLDSPQGVALDSSGHLYIADTHNHRIRRLDLATGTIVTLAGDGIPGFSGDNGPATAAHIDGPTALAIDSLGHLYFADSQNHRIRRVSSGGVITTVTGNGVQGFSGDGGPAAPASLDSPAGLAVDAGGNLYIADSHNNRIRKIDFSTDLISTIAGIGAFGFSGDSAQAANARLALPSGLTADASGNLYIADTANHRIRRIDAATGTISTIAGSGAQGFSGDGGPAALASLDSPRFSGISPTRQVVVADTGNQRVRQLAADSSISTVAGLGAAVPGTLTLTGASVVTYGSGQLTAMLNTAASAQGSITFLDTTASGITTAGAVGIALNSATLDLSALPADSHSIVATYSGDNAHGAAQSSNFVLTVAPVQLTASIANATMLYGQPVPALSGSIAGVLPRDASNVAASFTTTATPFSPAGSYPIQGTLAGSAAGNYIVGPLPLFVISPAPTLTTLSASPATAGSDQTVTLSSHVASTTSGTPSGTVTMLDGFNIVGSVPVTPNGDASLAASSLSAGSHSLSAVYSGDGNFLPSASAVSLVAVASSGNSSDFTLASAGAVSQTVAGGNSATFSFAVQVQNVASLTSPITLSAAGLPTGATASFNPAYIPPGSPSSAFTLTVALPKDNCIRVRHGGTQAYWPSCFCLSSESESVWIAGKRAVASVVLPYWSRALCSDAVIESTLVRNRSTPQNPTRLLSPRRQPLPPELSFSIPAP